jgi:hypothetical protein
LVFVELLVQAADVRSAVTAALTVFSFCFFFFCFLFDEFVFAAGGGGPGGRSQGTIGDGVGIDDYVRGLGLQGKELEVGGGGAQDTQEERSGAVLDLLGEDEAHEFGQGELDGVGVLEGGEGEGGVYGFLDIFVRIFVHSELVGAAAMLVVKETEAFGAEGGGSTLDAVGFDVLAAEDGACSGSDGCLGSRGQFVLLRCRLQVGPG